CPKNIRPVKGNHDVDFAEYVKIMKLVDARLDLDTDPDSNEDTIALYDTVNTMLTEAEDLQKEGRIKRAEWDARYSKFLSLPEKVRAAFSIEEFDESEYEPDEEHADVVKYTANIEVFDKFGTISDFLNLHDGNLTTLKKWATMLGSYPYYYRFNFMDKEVAIVHAGYTPVPGSIPVKFKDVEDFYLHAREEAIRFGGIRNGMVIAGHTPTIARKMYCFTGGRVYRHADESKNCVFYNVDCGCAYREVSPFGKMCCLKLDDETIYYLD
ncbi:MAG: hypothetical protein IK054_05350, partial [Lachnospiraceae bacterium]|nr:hypothetical protein [Lachnospiraceae bacterium]